MLCFAHTAEDSVVVQGQRNWLQRVCQFHYATLSLATMTSGKANLQMIKNSALCTKFFANFHFFSFSQAHAWTLQNHSISPCATTVLNNTVESSTIFHSNLMLRINWFYEI
jgi:hypothetical protein